MADRRIDLHVLDPEGTPADQFDAPGNTVPVALGMIGHGVGVGADVDQHAVIDADGNGMETGRIAAAQVILVWNGEADVRAMLAAVDPDARLPMGELHEEREALTLPDLGNFNHERVPGRTLVVAVGL